MRTIYKYELTEFEETIHMPNGAWILTVQAQRGKPCIWALVDTEEPLVQRRLLIYGTGREIKRDDVLFYIGTFQQQGREFVWHVFEDTEYDPDR